jgi:hypothetical protein
VFFAWIIVESAVSYLRAEGKIDWLLVNDIVTNLFVEVEDEATLKTWIFISLSRNILMLLHQNR